MGVGVYQSPPGIWATSPARRLLWAVQQVERRLNNDPKTEPEIAAAQSKLEIALRDPVLNFPWDAWWAKTAKHLPEPTTKDEMTSGDLASGGLIAPQQGLRRKLRYRVVTKAGSHTGAFIALYPAEAQAAQLAVPGGEPPDELHVTVAYFGDASKLSDEQRQTILDTVQTWSEFDPFVLKLDPKLSIFHGDADGDGKDPLIARVESEPLQRARELLVGMLARRDVPVDQTHPDYKPHLTLAYVPTGDTDPQGAPKLEAMTFPEVVVAFGDEVHPFRMGRVAKMLRQQTDGWHVYSQDGTKHLGGPYASKEQALARLRQVEHFKSEWVEKQEKLPPQVLTQIDLVVRELGSDLDEPVTQQAIDARRAAIARVITALGLRFSPEQLNAALAETMQQVKGIAETTREMLRSTLIDTIERAAAGDTSATQFDFARAIRQAWNGLSQARAETIARTEYNRAASTATQLSNKELGYQYKVWYTVGDDQVCPFCDENAAVGEIPIDEAFPSGDDAPPLHPNCRCNVASATGPGAMPLAASEAGVIEKYSESQPRDEHGQWTDGGSSGAVDAPLHDKHGQTYSVRYSGPDAAEHGANTNYHRLRVLGWQGTKYGDVGHLEWGKRKDGTSKIIAIEVSPGFKRRGIATAMLARARTITPDLQHASPDARTPEGLAWSSVAKFDPDQPRDERGQWTDTGASGATMAHSWTFADKKGRAFQSTYTPPARTSDGHEVGFHKITVAPAAGEPLPRAVNIFPFSGNRGAVGEISWRSHPSPNMPGKVENVDVHPDYRRAGIATAMLRQAREVAPGLQHSLIQTDEGKAWADIAKYSPDQPRDEQGQWTDAGGASGGLPEKPGSRPIPEGAVRLFHYTNPDALDAIRTGGLKTSAARGHTYGEPDTVWASAGIPAGGEGQYQTKPVVEFWMKPDELDIGKGRTPQELTDARSHVTMGDVPADRIIAIHEPWHAVARYMQDEVGQRPESIDELKWLDEPGAKKDYPNEARAYEWLKAHMPTKKYDESQPRDEQGKWTDTGASGGAAYRILSLDEAVAHAKAGFDHQFNHADPASTAAIYDYEREGYRALNKAMRNGTVTAEQQAEIDTLKKAFVGDLQQPIRVFRGLHGLSPDAPILKRGAVFTDHAFVSTALHPNRALGFYFNTPTSAFVEIDVPKGTKVAYGRIPETEMILPPGTSFRVKRVDVPKGKAPTLVHVEVVPSVAKYDDSEPRDEQGRWTTTGGRSLGTALPKLRPFDDVAEVRRRRAWGNSLTQDEKDAISRYVAGSSIMNAVLRGQMGRASLAKPERITGLDSAIRKSPPLERDGRVYRFVGAAVASNWKVGSVIRDKGFISVSTDAQFVRQEAKEGYKAVLQIHVPKRTRAAMPNAPPRGNSFKVEQELILPRGSRFKVVAKSGPQNVYLKMLPPGVKKYSEDQPRDPHTGEWTDAGGSSAGAPAAAPTNVPRTLTFPASRVPAAMKAFEAKHRGDQYEHAQIVGHDGTVLWEGTDDSPRAVMLPDDHPDFIGGVSTHNHPSGTAPSTQDILIMKKMGLGAARVARNGDSDTHVTLTPAARKMTLKSFANAVNEIDAATQKRIQPRIFTRSLPVDMANKYHSDLVLSRLADAGLIKVEGLHALPGPMQW